MIQPFFPWYERDFTSEQKTKFSDALISFLIFTFALSFYFYCFDSNVTEWIKKPQRDACISLLLLRFLSIRKTIPVHMHERTPPDFDEFLRNHSSQIFAKQKQSITLLKCCIKFKKFQRKFQFLRIKLCGKSAILECVCVLICIRVHTMPLPLPLPLLLRIEWWWWRRWWWKMNVFD